LSAPYHNIKGTNRGLLLSPFGEKLFYGDNRDLFTVHLSDGTLWTSNRSLEEHITVFGPDISENSLRKENGYKPRGMY